MAKTRISGTHMVIESSATVEQIKKLERFDKSALSLKDSEGKKDIFKVCTASEASVSNFGVAFATNGYGENAKAVIEIPLPQEASANPKQYVAENYGNVIRNLNKIEENFATAISAVEQEQKAIVEAIEG